MRKQLLVSVDRGETRVAILESEGSPQGGAAKGRGRGSKQNQQADDWRVAELYIERKGNRSIVGNVYKGKVDNVLPGLEAAFVDIGLDKNGFLHADDVVFPGGVASAAAAAAPAPASKRISGAPQARPGDPGPGDQGPAEDEGPAPVDAALDRGALPRLRAAGEGVGVSRRLEDKERDRLRRAAQKIDIGEGGVIVRTAAQGAKREDFEREIKYLHKLHEVLQQRAKDTPAPAMVFQEADLSVRVARDDIFSGEFEKAIVDDEASTTGSSPSSTGPRRSCSSGSSSGTRTSRCSRSTAWRTRSSRC